jgi:hypothetical protein
MVAVAVPTGASTFLAMSQEELVAVADAVVVGEVMQVQSYWNEGATAIVTDALVRVDETLAGNASGVVQVRTFGGQVGPVRIEAHGFPVFERGQRVVLHLQDEGDAARVVGYQQGHFRILVRKSDGVQVAVPTVDSGAHLITRDGSPVQPQRVRTLDTLRQQVRDAAAAGVRHELKRSVR